MALKSRNIQITKDEDIKKFVVGVINQDIGEQKLLERGIPVANLQPTSSPRSIIQKLEAKRIDLWCYDSITAFYLIKSNQFNVSDYEVIYTLAQNELFFAFSKNVSDKIIKSLQDALEQLVKSGKYDKILAKYAK